MAPVLQSQSTGAEWRCHGNDNADMVDKMHRAGIIRTPAIAEAMAKVDRQAFVVPEAKREAYADHPLSIGYGATISAPHMHAHCLELLAAHLKPGMTALDVGSGSGYLSAVMVQMVGPEGRVVGIDHIDKLVDWSRGNLQQSSAAAALQSEHNPAGNLVVVLGDGREGVPQHAPYDCIHVGAAAPTTPSALLDQLKPGGRMVIPVGTSSQDLLVYDKAADGRVTSRSAMGVRYVPLTDAAAQLRGY